MPYAAESLPSKLPADCCGLQGDVSGEHDGVRGKGLAGDLPCKKLNPANRRLEMPTFLGLHKTHDMTFPCTNWCEISTLQ